MSLVDWVVCLSKLELGNAAAAARILAGLQMWWVCPCPSLLEAAGRAGNSVISYESVTTVGPYDYSSTTIAMLARCAKTPIKHITWTWSTCTSSEYLSQIQ